MPGGRGRGGRRSGQVGKPYANRSDLRGGPQPIQAAPGGQYGSVKASEDAQRAIPMGTPELAGAAPTFTGKPEGMPAPGSMGDLFADSTAPDEDVMNGARLGPGGGPEAIGLGQARRDADMVKLQRALAAWEEVAARPDATNATRSFVRNLQAQLIGTT